MGVAFYFRICLLAMESDFQLGELSVLSEQAASVKHNLLTDSCHLDPHFTDSADAELKVWNVMASSKKQNLPN